VNKVVSCCQRVFVGCTSEHRIFCYCQRTSCLWYSTSHTPYAISFLTDSVLLCIWQLLAKPFKQAVSISGLKETIARPGHRFCFQVPTNRATVSRSFGRILSDSHPIQRHGTTINSCFIASERVFQATAMLFERSREFVSNCPTF
jgi:hypothetical protein